MANPFQITISAIDRTTEVVRRINANMERITRPITQIRQSVRQLGAETGLDRVGAGLGGVGRSAGGLLGQLTSLLGPLLAIGGGGIIAGIFALAAAWGLLSSKIQLTADLIGISSGQLQSLRNAGAVAGVSVESLDSALASLGNTMEDAMYGRNQQALAILARLGVGIHKTADGSIDAARGFRDLSSAISSVKSAQVQSFIARAFGLESALPLLRQGPQAVAELEQQVASLGGVMGGQAVASAVAWQKSMNLMQIAIGGLRNSIGDQLLPILRPLLMEFTNWIAANRQLIAIDVGNFIRGIASGIAQLDFKSIGAAVQGFIQDLRGVVDWFGGWKNAAIALVLVLNASLLGGVLNLTLAVGNLAVVAVPAAIRVFGLLAAGMGSTVVPAVVAVIMKLRWFTASLALMTSGVPVLGASLAWLSSAFAATGAAIAATPVGWLIAGIAGIALGVVAIYKNWDSIGEYFSAKFKAVKAAFNDGFLNGVVKGLMEFNPVVLIADAINGLSKWLVGIDLYPAGQKMIAGLIRGMKSIVGMLPKSVLSFFGISEWNTGPEKVLPKVAQSLPAVPMPITQPETGLPKAASPVPAVPMPMPKPMPMPITSSDRILNAGNGQSGNKNQGKSSKNNNPGNLRSWGDNPTEKGFAVFPNLEAGLLAATKNLQAQQTKHGLNTIAGIINRWAPPKENNTGAYISSVSKRTGFAPDAPLNLNDAKTVAPLLSAIVKQEGNGAGVTEEMIQRVVSAQLGGNAGGAAGAGGSAPQRIDVALTLHGLPAGTSASAQTRNGQALPVRVMSTMPTGVTP